MVVELSIEDAEYFADFVHRFRFEERTEQGRRKAIIMANKLQRKLREVRRAIDSTGVGKGGGK
jgi:hypothetical protein